MEDGRNWEADPTHLKTLQKELGVQKRSAAPTGSPGLVSDRSGPLATDVHTYRGADIGVKRVSK